MDIQRKLASVRMIDKIESIPDADAIECAYVGGWPVVVKKGEYKAGDLAIYFEIDSWIPTSLAPFLTKSGKYPSVYNGVEGERLKTIKLRGQISQGLLLPLNTVDSFFSVNEDDDLTEVLNIQKWEKPMSAQLAGLAKGNFPFFIRKTDQERVQNLKKELYENIGQEFEVTLKMDGSSATYYLKDGEYGVCSRNFNLKLEGNEDNTFIQTGIKYDLENVLKQYGKNIALQGEMCGPGIQNNYQQLKEVEFFVFDIFDIDNQRYFTPEERYSILYSLNQYAEVLINHVRVIEQRFILDCIDPRYYISIANTNIPGTNIPIEGLVFKRLDGKFSFKAINDQYLLKTGN